MFLYDDSKINIVIIIIISITNAIYDELFVRLILFLAVVLYSLDRLHYISKRKWMVQIWFKYVKILWNDEITEDNPRIRKSRCFRRNAIIFNIFALKHVLILINDTLMRAFYWIKLRTKATNLAKNSLVTNHVRLKTHPGNIHWPQTIIQSREIPNVLSACKAN